MSVRPEPRPPERRRRRRWPLILASLVAAASLVAVNSPLVAVQSIEVGGVEHADVQSALDEVGLGLGALLLWVDAAAVEAAVRQDPWIADVRVDRIWPDTVDIEVIEHQPVVWIEGVLEWMLVGRDGSVLEVADEPGTGLMVAAVAFPDVAPGVHPADPAWGEIVEMALVLSDDIGGTIVLEMRGPEMWTTAFGHDVRLGHPIDLADKGRTLRAMLAEEVPIGALIDVTSPLRPVIVPVGAQRQVETSGDEG